MIWSLIILLSFLGIYMLVQYLWKAAFDIKGYAIFIPFYNNTIKCKKLNCNKYISYFFALYNFIVFVVFMFYSVDLGFILMLASLFWNIYLNAHIRKSYVIYLPALGSVLSLLFYINNKNTAKRSLDDAQNIRENINNDIGHVSKFKFKNPTKKTYTFNISNKTETKQITNKDNTKDPLEELAKRLNIENLDIKSNY